jgi:hypothetical protein
MTTGQMERVIFDRAGGVLVTSTRIEIDGTTYAVAGIVSVKPERLPAQRGTAIVVAAFGVASLALGAMIDAGPMMGIGAVLLAAGALWAWRIRDRYAVKIVTAAGTIDAFVSESKDLAAEVSLAIKTAVTERR